jgi:hypothetical protein
MLMKEHKNYRFLSEHTDPEYITPLNLTAQPLVSFEDSIKPLYDIVDHIDQFAYLALDFAKKTSPHLDNGMSIHEIAALNLYTQESTPKRENSVYWLLNKCLRDPKREGIQPFLGYIRLLFEAFSKLQPYDTTKQLYRAINSKISTDNQSDQKIRWWAFSSASCSVEMLAGFAGGATPTVFSFRCSRGFDISPYSLYPAEREILIVPPIQFKVKGIQRSKMLHL